MKRGIFLLFAVCLAMIALVGTASAVDFSFNGSFTQDDNVQLFNFSVGATSTVTLRTWSYAGGVDAAGQLIPEGGFDPILALFDSAGNLINQNDDGGASVPASIVTGAHFDTFLQSTLGAGTYTVAVMQYDNFANGPTLADGFLQQGNPDFTHNLVGQPGGLFWDVTENERTANWEFDILNVDQAVEPGSVPEPATFIIWSLLGAFGIAIGWRRRSA